jgi:hypothetical protein
MEAELARKHPAILARVDHRQLEDRRASSGSRHYQGKGMTNWRTEFGTKGWLQTRFAWASKPPWIGARVTALCRRVEEQQ